MTRGIAAASAAAMAVLLLSACGADDDQAPVDRAAESPAATSTPSAPASPPDAPGGDAGGDLPARAEMDEGMRILARAMFLELLSDEPGLASVTEDERVAAGHAMCDAMDRGDSFRSVLIVGAGMVPTAGSAEDVAALAGVAGGTLCPEHADYTD